MSRKNKQTGKKRRRFVPSLCRILGTIIIAVVIGMCLPLTAPRFAGYEIYNVVSGSMEPEIPVGSVLYVQPVDPATVEEGAIIAFQSEDGVIAHRVQTNRTSLGEFVTKGDANDVEDLAPVPYDAMIGEVVLHLPFLGQLMSLYASTIGKVYLLLALGCGVMLNVLGGMIQERQREEAELEQAVQEAIGQGGFAPLVEQPKGEPGAGAAGAGGTPKPKRGRTLRRVLIVLLAIIFVGSGGVVGFVTYSRHQSDLIYKEASRSFTEEVAESVDAASDAIEQKAKTVAPKKVDFEGLRAVNEDVVGWLYCEGTPIDYPVLHGKDNNEYLRHDYTREYNINGSIFVDCDNERGFVDANSIVYGHHMDHGAMFATLDQWADQSYYEEHPVMWLLTPEQDYQVVLVSGHHTSAYSNMYEIIHEHGEKFDKYLDEAVELSDFVPVEGATVNHDRNYIMLTTCAYIFDNARYVLHGKLVPVDSAGGVPLG